MTLSETDRRSAIVVMSPQDQQISESIFNALGALPTIDLMPFERMPFPNGAYLARIGIPVSPAMEMGIHGQVESLQRIKNVLVPVVITGNLDDPTVLDRINSILAEIGDGLKGGTNEGKGRYLSTESKLFHFLIMADARQDAHTNVRLGDDRTGTIFHGEANSARILARNLKYLGRSDGVVTLDYHSRRAARFFDAIGLPHINISAVGKFHQWLKSHGYLDGNSVIASCDYGDLTRAHELSQRTGIPIKAIIQKTRRDQVLEASLELTNVAGKRVFIWDDMISSAGTLVKNVDLLIDNGASEVVFMATHPVFAGGYEENIKQLKEKYGEKVKIVTTNSLSEEKNRLPAGVEIIDITDIITATAQILLEANSFADVITKLVDLGYVHNLQSPDEVIAIIKGELRTSSSTSQSGLQLQPSVTAPMSTS